MLPEGFVELGARSTMGIQKQLKKIRGPCGTCMRKAESCTKTRSGWVAPPQRPQHRVKGGAGRAQKQGAPWVSRGRGGRLAGRSAH